MTGAVQPAAAAPPAGPRRSRGSDGGARDARFARNFVKTKVCIFGQHGQCTKAESCNFAHGEAQPLPDFKKTSLCKAWLAHRCPRTSSECPRAHGRSELRATEPYAKPNKAKFADHGGASGSADETGSSSGASASATGPLEPGQVRREAEVASEPRTPNSSCEVVRTEPRSPTTPYEGARRPEVLLLPAPVPRQVLLLPAPVPRQVVLLPAPVPSHVAGTGDTSSHYTPPTIMLVSRQVEQPAAKPEAWSLAAVVFAARSERPLEVERILRLATPMCYED